MRLKDGFILRKIAKSDVLIPMGDNIANFNGIITLNDTSAFLLRLLKEDVEIDTLVDSLVKEYEVEKSQAREDVESFINELSENNMIIGV